MTASTDVSVSSGRPEQPLGALWRAQATKTQERGLPSGRVAVSCPSRVGAGGLGRHLQEILDALERGGAPSECICEEPPHAAHASALGLTDALAPLTRFSPAWRMWGASVAFDRDAAHRLPTAEHLIAFNGTALEQFNVARSAGFQSLSLVAANSHLRQVVRQHTLAHRAYPGIERPWVTHLVKRNLAEYERADRIYVASRYIWESFAQEGFDDSRLSHFPLTPDPRYAPDPSPSSSSTFDILYVGSLMVHKGVALLLDAFARLPHPDMRLRLLGGWSTRGMRRLLEQACTRDPRISVGPGDPLGPLSSAQLCVHPAYEDGFAYAPAEALACGVPVIVSEDTGMRELIEPGVDGLIVPTGELAALMEAIEAVYRREALGG
jgi:glycosyltransferase involved in cell wall biosynthesis